ncbi:MAG TPA: cupin domain-containing protein [Roseateles sp.]
MKLTSFALACSLLAATSSTAYAQATDSPNSEASPRWRAGLTRTDLARQDVSKTGYELIQSRVDFAPGVASPRHSHPGEEVAFVLEGTLEYQLAGRAPVILTAGSALVIPAGTPHIARNVGDGKASELATYFVRKDQPLVKVEH